jgi:hypothetical protein
MSALGGKADIDRKGGHVCFRPKADVSGSKLLFATWLMQQFGEICVH